MDVTQPVSLRPKKRTLMDFLNLECSVVELTQLILSPLKKKTQTTFSQQQQPRNKDCFIPYSDITLNLQLLNLSNPKRSAINRTYSLSQRLEVLQYMHTYILKLRLHVISVFPIHEWMERSSSQMIGPVK